MCPCSIRANDRPFMLGPNRTGSVVVRKKLEQQFQRRTWAKKLHLWKKLFMLRLDEGGSICKHVKEIFDKLAVIGDAMSEEDRVVHLLASPTTCW